MKSVAYKWLFVVALWGLLSYAFSFAAEECEQDKPKNINANVTKTEIKCKNGVIDVVEVVMRPK